MFADRADEPVFIALHQMLGEDALAVAVHHLRTRYSRIPARPFFDPSDEVQSDILRSLLDHLTGKLEGRSPALRRLAFCGLVPR